MKCVRPNCENERLARGLCGSHYKKAHHARILPPSGKMRSPLVDAAGSRRRIQDLLLCGHTSETIAARTTEYASITPMEVRRIFSGRRLRVREEMAQAIERAHYDLEGVQGPSVRTANWAQKQGYVRLDQYADPDNPRSRPRRLKGVMRDEIVHLIDFGWGDRAITERLGCARSYVETLRAAQAVPSGA